MPTLSSDENYVCLSVKCVDCDKTQEKSVKIFMPYERSFSLVFWEKKWLMAGDPFYLKFWVSRPVLERNCRFWSDITRNTSAVTPSEKSSVNTNRKSTTCFPMSLRWSLSPRGGSKTQYGRFRYKIALRLKKVSYKVSVFENCQRQTCQAFIGLLLSPGLLGVNSLTVNDSCFSQSSWIIGQLP